jgi:integrase
VDLAVFRFVTRDNTTQVYYGKREVPKTISGLKSSDSRRFIFNKCKSIIAFGLKRGQDAKQIGEALLRMKVLWTAEPSPNHDPNPISRSNFHILLSAGNGFWRPWLLRGLNLCLHLGETCTLMWGEFDLKAGTYATIRNKSKGKRIPRAATLWPETIETLKALPRKGPYALTSKHGTCYNSNGRGNDFRDLCETVGLAGKVGFESIRDGAYPIATGVIEGACRHVIKDRMERAGMRWKVPGAQAMDQLIYSRKEPWRQDILALIAGRIVYQGSKLALTGVYLDSALWELCGHPAGKRPDVEEHAYLPMDRLLERQESIQKQLAQKHLQDGCLVYYDMTSSYAEGDYEDSDLVTYGYNRDGKRGHEQMAIGLLTTAQGCPVAVRVFRGNNHDDHTVTSFHWISDQLQVQCDYVGRCRRGRHEAPHGHSGQDHPLP